MTDVPLLQVRQLEVVYNRVATAIQGVSLDVPEGSIVALVGTNGAGKTTTLRAISGFLPSEDVAITDGSITLCGKRIIGRMPHQLAKAGVILVPEREKVFATLSVQDNLAFAARPDASISIERIHGYFPRALLPTCRISKWWREADAGDRHGAPLPTNAFTDR